KSIFTAKLETLQAGFNTLSRTVVQTFCSCASSFYLAGSRWLFPGEVSHSLFNVMKNGLT
ncbi:hypothetical protein, partial [Bacteroides acidifaciens]|uniref:hypothetical protein n=1 Tax=Bacteroides acidifaciens TaxID=85831 RepID=UPI001C7D0089